jgi:hypothetical protein
MVHVEDGDARTELLREEARVPKRADTFVAQTDRREDVLDERMPPRAMQPLPQPTSHRETRPIPRA